MAKYELTSVALPKLTGRPLRMFARSLESVGLRGALLPQLLAQGGIIKLRHTQFDEPPTMFPLVEPVARKTAATADEAGPVLPENGRMLPFNTAADYANAYREGRITPIDVAQRIFAAVAESERGETPLRLFIAQNEADVLAQAEAAADRWRKGEPLTPLDGVPVAVKDEVDQRPYPTTVGTTFLGQQPAGADATVVARLRAAGALLIGKTNMHEIGINPNGLNVHYGPVRNPYDTARDSGGSSSGSAAAVAAGICPVSVGADGGGSIRVPAALCGAVGLKATFGRISEHGAAPLTWSMGHLGPIGASVADVALAYEVMAGPDPLDRMTLKQTAVSAQNWTNPDLTGIRLGVYRPWFEHAAPDIVAANEQALQALLAAGATLHEIEIPELDEMRIAHAITILSEMVTSMNQHPEHRRDFGAAVRVNLALGRAFSSSDYLNAQRMRTRALRIFADVYEQVDVVVTPATAVTAPLIPADGLSAGWSDLSTVTELMRFVIPGNLIGLPALSVPVGYDAAGLPVGMQLMGRHWEEHVLLQLAYKVEQVVERKRPSPFFDILNSENL